MKKLTIALLVAAALLIAGTLALAEASTTVLVYMCGADLQDAGCVDLYEMAEAETGGNTNVVVMAGGAKKWDDEDLEGGTRNLVVISEGAFDRVDDAGQTSMGSAESLLEFMEYGLTEYPAERTVFVLWNHGGGAEGGICFDELANDDGLTLVEIADTLNKLDDRVPGWHIDVFGCDACMMASYELAAVLAGHSIDYYVASEELEPGVGWYYTPWIKAVDKDPGMSDEALCQAIVDSFMEDNLTYAPDDPFCLSAVDLTRFEPLKSRMEDFAATLDAAVDGGELASLRRSRSRLYTFGSFCDGSWDMVDMGAAVEAFSSVDPGAASDVRRLLDECVVCNRQSDKLAQCSGLAVLIPEDTPEDYFDFRDGMDVSGYVPNWLAFLDNYVGRMNGSDYNFSDVTPVQASVGDTVSGADNTLWDPAWLEEDEEFGEEYTISETEYGFTIQLSQQDLENLDYVEGMLLWDLSDEETDCFVDLGLSRNNLIDWRTGVVTSLFDGSWPMLGDQPVPLYDQTSTENSRRSLIPVKLNGEYTYLVVVFSAGSDVGRIIGANAGYADNGLPIRETTKLQEGDVIVPVYTMYVGDADSDEEYEEQEYEGEEIVWRDGMTVNYVSLVDDYDDYGDYDEYDYDEYDYDEYGYDEYDYDDYGDYDEYDDYGYDEYDYDGDGDYDEYGYDDDDDEPFVMEFCFVINDIFGDYTMSEFVEFEM